MQEVFAMSITCPDCKGNGRDSKRETAEHVMFGEHNIHICPICKGGELELWREDEYAEKYELLYCDHYGLDDEGIPSRKCLSGCRLNNCVIKPRPLTDKELKGFQIMLSEKTFINNVLAGKHFIDVYELYLYTNVNGEQRRVK